MASPSANFDRRPGKEIGKNIVFLFCLISWFLAISLKWTKGIDHDPQQRNRTGKSRTSDICTNSKLRLLESTSSKLAGGLLVALVIKHADNILRGFATALDAWLRYLACQPLKVSGQSCTREAFDKMGTVLLRSYRINLWVCASCD